MIKLQTLLLLLIAVTWVRRQNGLLHHRITTTTSAVFEVCGSKSSSVYLACPKALSALSNIFSLRILRSVVFFPPASQFMSNFQNVNNANLLFLPSCFSFLIFMYINYTCSAYCSKCGSWLLQKLQFSFLI